jgi:4'-phosphopantetheinyl transferase
MFDPIPASLPSPSEVHIWLLRLDGQMAPERLDVLSEDERSRAKRFRLAADRQRFVATRAALRMLLGGYLKEAPGSLEFDYSPFGRPLLPLRWQSPELLFSVAHSGGFALLAFGCGLPLGVDLEDLTIDRDYDNIAKAILPADQHRDWLLAEPIARKHDLLQLWTRREALGKALGTGLSTPPQAFDEALTGPDRFIVRNVDAIENCVAAVAARTPVPKIRLGEFFL